MSTKAAEVGAAPPLTAFRLPGRDGKMTALLSVPGDVPAVVLSRARPASAGAGWLRRHSSIAAGLPAPSACQTPASATASHAGPIADSLRWVVHNVAGLALSGWGRSGHSFLNSRPGLLVRLDVAREKPGRLKPEASTQPAGPRSCPPASASPEEARGVARAPDRHGADHPRRRPLSGGGEGHSAVDQPSSSFQWRDWSFTCEPADVGRVG